MKKIIILSLFPLFLTACNDKYADLRKMTVQNYLDNKDLMDDVLEKCRNREIKDEEICETVREAMNSNHSFW